MNGKNNQSFLKQTFWTYHIRTFYYFYPLLLPMDNEHPEKKKLLNAAYYPSMLVCILWLINGIEWMGDVSFANLGIYPHRISGLMGILFSPLIHADAMHLLNNSVPLLVLTIALIYFYKPVALKIFLLIWSVTGLCVWIGGREAYHIGASGVIYGLASFLFFSGIFRKNPKLMAISLLVIFLYGSMVWGIFPFFPDVSWESHLFGLLSGLTFASIYSHDESPPETIEISDDPDDAFPYWEVEDKDAEQNEN
jgi:membrane associated rhomboid family serine protease